MQYVYFIIPLQNLHVRSSNMDVSDSSQAGTPVGGEPTEPTESSAPKVSFYLGDDQVINRSVSTKMDL